MAYNANGASMKTNINKFVFQPFSIDIRFDTWEELDKFVNTMLNDYDLHGMYNYLMSVRDLSKPQEKL